MDERTMEQQNLQSPGKQEGLLGIEWPEKEKLLMDKNKYIEDHLIEMKRRIIESGLVTEEGVELNELAGIGLSAKFMLLEMQKISPIPFEGKTEIVDDFEYYEHEGWLSTTTDKTGKQVITIYLNVLDQMLVKGDSQLEAKIMSGSVHEFAHLLYYQEANIFGSSRKKHGLEENRLYQRYGRLTSWESNDESYVSLDLETRARLWQLAFLKRYFADSKYIQIVEKELDLGRQTRSNRERIRLEDEEWKKNQREVLGMDETE